MRACSSGPYCTGWVTPSGNSARLMVPHPWQVLISARCSVTSTFTGGISKTWRRIFLGSLATFAALHSMHFDMIWLGYCFQRVAFMARLSTALLPALFSQAAVAGFLETITGRRLAAVSAVLVDLVFKGL